MCIARKEQMMGQLANLACVVLLGLCGVVFLGVAVYDLRERSRRERVTRDSVVGSDAAGDQPSA